MNHKAILLVNTGTPDKPEKKYVRKYLSEFLNDPRVIDMPWLLRKILVNLIIVPFRTAGSTKLYRRLFTEKGSPLLFHLRDLTAKLQVKLENNYSVVMGMRYGNPSLKSALGKIKSMGISELIIFPLFPQYASSTTGSVNEFVMKEISKWNEIPEIKFKDQFFSHSSFIGALANLIGKYDPEKYDHVLFSYHSLPLRHIQAVHPVQDISTCSCEREMPGHGEYCYKAACYETTRLLAQELNLPEGTYSTTFQSRFSKNWLGPFTDDVLKELAGKGKKRVLAIAPSFVADCLETVVEFEGYRELFKKWGGEDLTLVESLNAHDDWVEAIIEIAELR